MSNTNTGGPAFPIPLQNGQSWQGMAPCDGMTLRDYFAAKAMTAVIADWLNSGDIFQDTEIADVIARDCYIVSDAMLKAREA